MTWEDFTAIFAMLAIQLRATDADAATGHAYFEALKDLDLELVQMAAAEMAKRGGSEQADSPHWFPKTSEWRSRVEAIDYARTRDQQQRIRELHRQGQELCTVCQDTGWRMNTEDRMERCDCRKLRRLEVLGVRPFPQLPEAPNVEPVNETQMQQIRELIRPAVKAF